MSTANTPVELDMTGIKLEKIKVDPNMPSCDGCFFDMPRNCENCESESGCEACVNNPVCSNRHSKYSKAAGLGLCYTPGASVYYIFKQVEVESAEVSA